MQSNEPFNVMLRTPRRSVAPWSALKT